MLLTFKCHNRDCYHHCNMLSSRIVICQNYHNRSGLIITLIQFVRKLTKLHLFYTQNLKQCNQKVKLDKICVKTYAATVWSSHTTCSVNKLERDILIILNSVSFTIKYTASFCLSFHYSCHSSVWPFSLESKWQQHYLNRW